jgi:hypothetical protein
VQVHLSNSWRSIVRLPVRDGVLALRIQETFIIPSLKENQIRGNALVLASRNVGARGVVVWSVLLILLLIAGLALRDFTMSRRVKRAANVTVMNELGAAITALQAARDSTGMQLDALAYVLSWMENQSDASSAGLIDALSRLKHRHRAPTSLDAVATLIVTCNLEHVGDESVRRRLVALQRSLGQLAHTGEAAFEHFRLRLEDSLSPGMWRFVFLGASGTHPVDYRTTLHDLHAAGFDRVLRTLMRGASDYAQHLGQLAGEAAALADKLQSGSAGSDQP